jgi:hypothetical protein
MKDVASPRRVFAPGFPIQACTWTRAVCMPHVIGLEETFMLTRFVFGCAMSGAFLVLGMPLAFGSLLTLRYPEKQAGLNGHASERRGDETAHEAAAFARGDGPGFVIGPERLERLRASRQHPRVLSSDFDRAA